MLQYMSCNYIHTHNIEVLVEEKRFDILTMD